MILKQKIYRNCLACLLAIFLATGSVFAQDKGDAGQAGEFLRWGAGGRALAMGRAFTSIANDASAPYWNPAGLFNLRQLTASFMHAKLFGDTKYQYGSVIIPRISRAPQFGIGLLFGFGQFVGGIIAIGQFSLGVYFGAGQFATGLTAIGQFAFGKYVLAQAGYGEYVWSVKSKSPEAIEYFTNLWNSVKTFLLVSKN